MFNVATRKLSVNEVLVLCIEAMNLMDYVFVNVGSVVSQFEVKNICSKIEHTDGLQYFHFTSDACDSQNARSKLDVGRANLEIGAVYLKPSNGEKIAVSNDGVAFDILMTKNDKPTFRIERCLLGAHSSGEGVSMKRIGDKLIPVYAFHAIFSGCARTSLKFDFEIAVNSSVQLPESIKTLISAAEYNRD